MSSSFRSNRKSTESKCGYKINPNNRQFNISYGIKKLDEIMNGGLSVGSMVVIESDKFDFHSSLVGRIILNSLYCNFTIHGAFSNYKHYKKVVKHFNKNQFSKTVEVEQKLKNQEENLEISWRYSYLKKDLDQDDNPFKEHRKIEEKNINLFDPGNTLDVLLDLLNKFKVGSSGKLENINVFIIENLFSGFWGNFNKERIDQILKNLLIIKSALRHSNCILIITVSDFLENPFFNESEKIKNCLLTLTDCYFSVKQIDKSVPNPYAFEYDGFLTLRKLVSLNCFSDIKHKNLEYGLLIRDSRYQIKELRMPVESDNSEIGDQLNLNSLKF